MERHKGTWSVFLAAMVALGLGAPAWAAPFPIARIYIEYNSSANDLGFHVLLDGEDWKTVKIVHPAGNTIFEVEGKGGYRQLGMTELFFEGAEPSLDEFPLEDLLALFPAGRYTFIAETVAGGRLMSRATLSHAVPAGPVVSTAASPTCSGTIEVRWEPVTGPAAILPNGNINIVGYQVIVGSFQVTVPDTITSVTVPKEYYQTLGSGTHPFEVLAIDVSGNQTITEGTFTK